MVKGLWIEVATIATALAGPLTQGSHIFLSCFCGSNLQDQQVYSECIEAVACSLCVSTNSLYAFVKSLSCLSTLSVRSPRSSTCVWIWEIYPFRSFCIPFCRAMSIYVHVCSETALSEAGRSAKESVIFPPSSSLYSLAAWYLRIFLHTDALWLGELKGEEAALLFPSLVQSMWQATSQAERGGEACEAKKTNLHHSADFWLNQ